MNQSSGRGGRVETYRDLRVWRCGMDLAKEVYLVTRAMPDEEKFGLTSQMRRAAVSIPSNIAEGYARQLRRDYLRHLRIARGSLAELRTQYELALDIGFPIHSDRLWELMLAEERMLQVLIMRIRQKARGANDPQHDKS